MVARTLRQKGLSVATGGEDLLRDCPSIITIRPAAPSYALAQELLRDPSDKLSHAAKNREAFAHFNVVLSLFVVAMAGFAVFISQR